MKRNQRRMVLAGAAACLIGGLALAAPLDIRADETGLRTLAGVPGNHYQDGGGAQALFASPMGLDVKDGLVVITDTENNLIRGYRYGHTYTIAGNNDEKDAYGNAMGGYKTSVLDKALFDSPVDCVILDNGKILVADRDNHGMRLVSEKWVTKHTGNGIASYKEGPDNESQFSSPSGLALGADGTVYVADAGNHCVRMIRNGDLTSLFAGRPETGGYADGPVSEAMFMEPTAVAAAADGTVYVADSGNQRIRRIRDGVVTTVAGSGLGQYLDTEYLTPGYADGAADQAQFRFPEGLCVAGDILLVADTGNHVIRAITPSGRVYTIAGTGDAGYRDGAPLEAELNRPSDLAWENGTLYIMDSGNSALRAMPFDPEKWMEMVE